MGAAGTNRPACSLARTASVMVEFRERYRRAGVNDLHTHTKLTEWQVLCHASQRHSGGGKADQWWFTLNRRVMLSIRIFESIEGFPNRALT